MRSWKRRSTPEREKHILRWKYINWLCWYVFRLCMYIVALVRLSDSPLLPPSCIVILELPAGFGWGRLLGTLFLILSSLSNLIFMISYSVFIIRMFFRQRHLLRCHKSYSLSKDSPKCPNYDHLIERLFLIEKLIINQSRLANSFFPNVLWIDLHNNFIPMENLRQKPVIYNDINFILINYWFQKIK